MSREAVSVGVAFAAVTTGSDLTVTALLEVTASSSGDARHEFRWYLKCLEALGATFIDEAGRV